MLATAGLNAFIATIAAARHLCHRPLATKSPEKVIYQFRETALPILAFYGYKVGWMLYQKCHFGVRETYFSN